VSRLWKQCGILNISNLIGLHGFLWGTNWTVSTATSSQYLAVNWADCLDNVGSLTSHNLIGLHGLLQECLYFTVYCCCWFSSAQSLSGLSPVGLKTIFYWPKSWDSPTWRARSPNLYPPRTGCPSYTPGHWVPFPSPLTTRRATVELFYPHTPVAARQRIQRIRILYASFFLWSGSYRKKRRRLVYLTPCLHCSLSTVYLTVSISSPLVWTCALHVMQIRSCSVESSHLRVEVWYTRELRVVSLTSCHSDQPVSCLSPPPPHQQGCPWLLRATHLCFVSNFLLFTHVVRTRVAMMQACNHVTLSSPFPFSTTVEMFSEQITWLI
jgi:hypothetical protein